MNIIMEITCEETILSTDILNKLSRYQENEIKFQHHYRA